MTLPPPVPALPDTERRTTYSITAQTGPFAVNFALLGDGIDYSNWIEVWLNGALIPASGNWTITSPTGPIATLPRPITDAVLTFATAQTGTVQIVGARRPRRTSQLTESQGVSARDHNQIFTDVIATQREFWDKTNDVTGRAVLAPPGETLALLPVLASRANMGACFNSVGNLTSCVSVPSSTFAAGSGITFTGTNPTTIAGQAILPGNDIGVSTAGSNVTISGKGGWKVENFRAINTVGFETVSMDMSADYAVLYNPVTGDTKTVVGAALTRFVTISSSGPASGGRDRAAAFAAGDVVWFYYIWGSSVGIGTTTSLTGPIATNGGGTTGPVLPSGYTHYCPLFPVPMIGSATLQPVMQLQGPSNIIVQDRRVIYPNPPVIVGGNAFPNMPFDFRTWVPPVARLTDFLADVEIQVTSGQFIGGAVFHTGYGNFGNLSLYANGADQIGLFVNEAPFLTYLPNQQFTLMFMYQANGVIISHAENTTMFVNGYTF